MNGRSTKDHFARLARYALNHKPLLAATVLMGVLGFSVPFVWPWLIRQLIDRVINSPAPLDQRMHLLWRLVLYGGMTALAFGISGYGRQHLTLKLAHRVVIDLRRDLFDHLQRLSLQFYSRNRTGSIVERLIHEVHAVAGVLHAGVILVFMDVAQLVLAFFLLFNLSVRLTVAVLVVIPLYVLVFKLMNPRVRRASEQLHRHFCMIFGNVQEQMAGVALIKTYAAEEREQRRFLEDNEDHYNYVVAQSHVGSIVGAASEILIHVGTTIIIGYGGYLAIRSGGPAGPRMTAGELTAFIGYVGILYGPLRRFADLNMVYQNSLAAMRRVFRVFYITPRVQEKAHPITLPPERGEVRYEHVCFRYHDDSDESKARLDEDDKLHKEPEKQHVESAEDAEHPSLKRWVLDDVSFTMKLGERVALVGPSGSGKTTLVSLLPRLYDVGGGRIVIDGHDVRDYSLKALRQAIGIVQQDSFVFSGTIRDNLCYGRPGASEEDMIAAAKAANAHGFITDLPGGYRAKLGERGVNLSGGQRQRLSIARAILKNPRILLLDEATSALDTESEALVQDALNRLMQHRTCLIIAHRLSTVRHADRILVLREGCIAESGKHDELLEKDGLYARLVHQQFGVQPVTADPEDPERRSVISA